MEIWRDVIGYEGLYQVSSQGRVKSVYRKVFNPGLNVWRIQKERILKTVLDPKGYVRITLSKEGKVKQYLLHRIVAKAFIPNPNMYPQINHKDENPENNSVDNLEWCTNLYNSNYGNHCIRVSEAQSIPIIQFSLSGEFIREWPSAEEAARTLKAHAPNILRCCYGGFFSKERNKWVNVKKASGFIWKFKDDIN